MRKTTTEASLFLMDVDAHLAKHAYDLPSRVRGKPGSPVERFMEFTAGRIADRVQDWTASEGRRVLSARLLPFGKTRRKRCEFSDRVSLACQRVYLCLTYARD